MNTDDIECYLPGESEPVSIDEFAAGVVREMLFDEQDGTKMPFLPEVFIYSPPKSQQ